MVTTQQRYFFVFIAAGLLSAYYTLNFPLCHHVQAGYGTDAASCQIGSDTYSPEIKRSAQEAYIRQVPCSLISLCSVSCFLHAYTLLK